MDKEAVPVLVVYPHPESSSNAVTVKFTVRTECFCFFFFGWRIDESTSCATICSMCRFSDIFCLSSFFAQLSYRQNKILNAIKLHGRHLQHKLYKFSPTLKSLHKQLNCQYSMLFNMSKSILMNIAASRGS